MLRYPSRESISNIPVRIEEISDAVDVSADAFHFCAVLSDGSVWCWGDNDDGQLGNGTTDPSRTPTRVTGIDDAVTVEAGGNATCVLRETGRVACYGANERGQLGDGTTEKRVEPVEVVGLEPVVALGQGEPAMLQRHRCALVDDGTVWCWGRNEDGQLGDGTFVDSLTPVQVTDW